MYLLFLQDCCGEFDIAIVTKEQAIARLKGWGFLSIEGDEYIPECEQEILEYFEEDLMAQQWSERGSTAALKWLNCEKIDKNTIKLADPNPFVDPNYV